MKKFLIIGSIMVIVLAAVILTACNPAAVTLLSRKYDGVLGQYNGTKIVLEDGLYYLTKKDKATGTGYTEISVISGDSSYNYFAVKQSEDAGYGIIKSDGSTILGSSATYKSVSAVVSSDKATLGFKIRTADSLYLYVVASSAQMLPNEFYSIDDSFFGNLLLAEKAVVDEDGLVERKEVLLSTDGSEVLVSDSIVRKGSSKYPTGASYLYAAEVVDADSKVVTAAVSSIDGTIIKSDLSTITASTNGEFILLGTDGEYSLVKADMTLADYEDRIIGLYNWIEPGDGTSSYYFLRYSPENDDGQRFYYLTNENGVAVTPTDKYTSMYGQLGALFRLGYIDATTEYVDLLTPAGKVIISKIEADYSSSLSVTTNTDKGYYLVIDETQAEIKAYSTSKDATLSLTGDMAGYYVSSVPSSNGSHLILLKNEGGDQTIAWNMENNTVVYNADTVISVSGEFTIVNLGDSANPSRFVALSDDLSYYSGLPVDRNLEPADAVNATYSVAITTAVSIFPQGKGASASEIIANPTKYSAKTVQIKSVVVTYYVKGDNLHAQKAYYLYYRLYQTSSKWNLIKTTGGYSTGASSLGSNAIADQIKTYDDITRVTTVYNVTVEDGNVEIAESFSTKKLSANATLYLSINGQRYILDKLSSGHAIYNSDASRLLLPAIYTVNSIDNDNVIVVKGSTFAVLKLTSKSYKMVRKFEYSSIMFFGLDGSYIMRDLKTQTYSISNAKHKILEKNIVTYTVAASYYSKDAYKNAYDDDNLIMALVVLHLKTGKVKILELRLLKDEATRYAENNLAGEIS
ncbi:MAG: hypothetical protein LBE09_02850 [Christensenellaceae bacterium]|jgi:hypothetical protein|nr:hypothetical protein [Christensenellaceae bacterium]